MIQKPFKQSLEFTFSTCFISWFVFFFFSFQIAVIHFMFSYQYLIFELSRWPSPNLTTSQLLWTGFKMNKHWLNDNQIHMCYVAVSCFYFGVPCFTSRPIPKSLICIQAEFPAWIFILIFIWSVFFSTIGLIPLVSDYWGWKEK